MWRNSSFWSPTVSAPGEPWRAFSRPMLWPRGSGLPICPNRKTTELAAAALGLHLPGFDSTTAGFKSQVALWQASGFDWGGLQAAAGTTLNRISIFFYLS